MSVRVTYAQFEVQGVGDKYIVAYDDEEGWYCNCPDRHYRKHECNRTCSSNWYCIDRNHFSAKFIGNLHFE